MIGNMLAGRYRIIAHLGSGGFGDTYLAEDTQLPDHSQCVVKHLKYQSSDPEILQIARRLFDTEARVLHKLGRHDQIPQLLAHFVENDEFYLVQEFIAGTSLSKELIPAQPWEESRVIAFLKDVLTTLAFVHQQQVIHRDLKPDNLIRRQSDSKIVVIDFGAVKQIYTQIATGGRMASTIAVGTLGYMPSEQASGHPQLSSDVYAIGILAIEALTGLSALSIPKDPQTLELDWQKNTRVSIELADILNKMVRFDFRQRYQSASEALEALSSLTLSSLSAEAVTLVVPNTTASNSTSIPTLVLPEAQGNTNIPTVAIAGMGSAPTALVAEKSQRSYKNIALIGLGIAGLSVICGALWSVTSQSNNDNDSSSKTNSAVLPSSSPFIRSKIATALYTKALNLSTSGKTKEAIEAYEQAIQQKPDYAEAWYGKAKELVKLKRYPEAITAYNEALKLNPNYTAAKNERDEIAKLLEKPPSSPPSSINPSTSTATPSSATPYSPPVETTTPQTAPVAIPISPPLSTPTVERERDRSPNRERPVERDRKSDKPEKGKGPKK